MLTSPDLLIDFGISFPNQLFVIRSKKDGKYIGYSWQKYLGLACFINSTNAEAFVTPSVLKDCEILEIDFDRARDIAKSVHNITCLLLLDNVDDPEIHHVS